MTHDTVILFDDVFHLLRLTSFVSSSLPHFYNATSTTNEIHGGATVRSVRGRLLAATNIAAPSLGANAQPSSRGRRRGVERELLTSPYLPTVT